MEVSIWWCPFEAFLVDIGVGKSCRPNLPFFECKSSGDGARALFNKFMMRMCAGLFDNEVGENRYTVQQVGDACALKIHSSHHRSQTRRMSRHTWDRRKLRSVAQDLPWSEWSQNDKQ